MVTAPYATGCLLAVAGEIARRARGSRAETTVKHKYRLMQDSPRTTAAQLFKDINADLARLKSPTEVEWWQARIGELCTAVGDSFPVAILPPHDGSFSLGYYQETARLAARRRQLNEQHQAADA